MGVLVSSASASVLRNAVLSAFAIFNSDDQAPPPVAVEEIGGAPRSRSWPSQILRGVIRNSAIPPGVVVPEREGWRKGASEVLSGPLSPRFQQRPA
jgi:hypothetical protein